VAAVPRTSVSEVNTTIMCDNEHREFFIGGLEKLSRVRSVSKVPWLGSIPLLGYLFSSESEVTRKHQLVAVVRCEHQMPLEVPTDDFNKTKDKVLESTKDLDSNTYGFDQFLLDSEKKTLDPLP
jgi:type II secretory pathway component GspD/PulD (secretin)